MEEAGGTAAMSKTRHILSLSGGKDSTALAIFMRDKVADMEYVFCDTCKELDETYEYLNRVEAYLGKKIVRINAEAGFDHWLQVFGGYLPGPNVRWCTKLLKLKPFEKYVGNDDVVSYIGIRADEDRVGYISTKPNIRAVFPYKEYGIDYAGVMRILQDSGIGLPPYLDWGRTHSGCYFCFFQKSIEWVRLLEKYPKRFAEAEAYEKISDDEGKTFTWNQGMSLQELRKPENVEGITRRWTEATRKRRAKRGDRKLVEVFAGMECEEEDRTACLICQL
jgi:3'-phosphoadenosine 5'-phosphosulfate sulfotransferase (PAPS reductase)/FAD synthetase